MSMVLDIRKSDFGNRVLTVSYLVHYDTLLQNATDIITRCDNYFITKFEKGFLQNVSGVLLQDAKVLLQNPTFITKFVGRCYVYWI